MLAQLPNRCLRYDCKTERRPMELATDKQRAHDLIEQLEQTQIPTAVRFLEFLLIDPVFCSIDTAPFDDEPLTLEEEQALSRADDWLNARGGRGIPHEEVLADFGLTTEDFPLQRNGA
jgi:hypothetical protein